jgi:hypothetical protein
MRTRAHPTIRAMLLPVGLLMLAPLLSSCSGGNDSLPSFGTVSGTVVDGSTLLGLSGASVTVAGIAATTGDGGSFSIRNVPVGRQNYSVAATGYTPLQNKSVEVKSNQTARIDAQLSLLPADAGTVHGTVTDAISGEPVEQVAVAVGTNTVVTSAEGLYTLASIASGAQTVSFTKAGYETRQETLTVVTGGSHLLSVTLTPRTTGIIAGSTRDAATSLALSGVTASIETLGSATSASDGSYQLTDIPAGTWVVRYARTGYQTVEREVTVTAAQTTIQDVSMLSPSRGALEGRVRNQTSGGLQVGVHVTIVELERTADTDSSGYYKIADVPDGVYTVLFSLTDYGSVNRTNIEVEGGQTTVLDVELAPTVAGLVGWVWEENATGGHGPAIAEASVRVGNQLTVLTTDEDGHYEAHNIPATVAGTTYTIYGWTSTHDLASVEVTLHAGEISQAPDLVLHLAQ